MVPNRSRRAPAAATIACAAAVLSLTAAIAPARAATGADAGTAGLSYVALGDSYSAGYGLQPLTGEPVPGCGQSSRDYPHQVAAALDLDLTDVSCSGAVSADITGTAQATGDGTAPAQDTALGPDTRIVTLTIGGDDLGFARIAVYCAAFSANGPLLTHPLQRGCAEHYTASGPDNLQAEISGSVRSGVAAALAAVHAAAPRAKVFVLGYPALAPDAANTPAGGCFRSMLGTDGYPFTTSDIPFLLRTGQALDAELASVTAAAGDTFVPTLTASLAHTPCAVSAQPAGTPWINGLSVASLAPPSLRPGSLHPDATGVAYAAGRLDAAIRAAFPPPPSPAKSPTASPSSAPPAARAAPPGDIGLIAAGSGAALAVIIAGCFLIRRRRRRARERDGRE